MRLAALVFLSFAQAEGAVVEYDLTVAQEEVDIAGRPAMGMTINGGIPGPTLRFTEGDTAVISVHNRMDAETSIHWHGVYVPPEMDGVPYVSFPPIPPGATFTYEFPVRQSGTYWYHSHSALQEQSGVYGPLVFHPPVERVRADRDYVVLFSDWTDEDPKEVMRALKRGSQWYTVQKGSGQSIVGAALMGRLGEYFKRELQRMPPMDISDVAYRSFLANGGPEAGLPARPGETVRVRMIDGSSATNFYLEFAGGPIEVVAADGSDVELFEEKRFLITVAETYDVLLHVPASGAYELRATAQDGSGHASVWVGSGERYPAPDVPRANLYQPMGGLSLRQVFALTPAGAMGMPDRDVRTGSFDEPGMYGMEGMEMEQGAPMDHGGMQMPGMDHEMVGMGTQSMQEAMGSPMRGGKCLGGLLAEDVACAPYIATEGGPERPWPPYYSLRAAGPTALDEGKPVREVRLTLDGDMERFVWSMDNRPLSESDSVLIRQGEVVRFIMINRTMMHHPMHLHGHLFRVINAQGDYAPLKHTVDVAPMSTTVIEFDAEEPGDWFFHCHILYHMESGMATVVHYEGFTPSPRVAAVRPSLYAEHWHAWAAADLLTNMSEGYATVSSSRWALTLDWEVGWRRVEETERETNVTATYFRDGFLNAYVGGTLSDESGDGGIVGLRYLLPLNIASDLRMDTEGDFRAVLLKEFMLTPRAGLEGEVQYDAESHWEGSVGLAYLLDKNFALFARWHSDYGWGGGLRIWL